MGCLFDCFRAAGGEPRAGRARAQLVSSSVIPAACPKVADRKTAPPSRNALSAVFLREDEGSRATSSGPNQDGGRRPADRELMRHEAASIKNNGALLQNPNEIRKGPERTDSVIPALSENMKFVDTPKTEDCQTPPESHQSSHLPDAMSSSWKGCNTSNLHDSEAVRKTEDSNGVHNELSTLDSCSFSSNNDDIYLDGSKLSFFSTPQKVNAEMHSPATNASNVEGLGNESSLQHLSEALNPVVDFHNSEVSSENFFQPNISDKDPKCAKNGTLVSIELSMSDECSLFQNSEGSVSPCNKVSDSMSTVFEEKRQTTEMAVHARRKLITNIGSDIEFPSLSEWLKPPNSRTSDSAKSSDDDRPIIGMVAAHWKNEEPENCTPQWWDGNGIPNSTNKYKEDQKVSWHAMSFEERLEKALSEEKLLSQRKCSTGNTSQFSGVEGEESDTAASQHLRVAAFT
ncbi:hypothetical protein QYE76_061531 [Lolium multiflorum]|uniref:Protein JASON-like n=1 Tax=Lolium multiflorum TaxID=4521 RepID=A0AAD8W4T1_LOLMU|nr:hypothetical protein QYE76_061531 [Lolium multiflorum]